MQIVGLDHVQLAMPIDGEEAARAFYGGVCGLTEVPKPTPLAKRGGCWFTGSNVTIHLGVEHDFTPARKAHPAFRVTDLTAAQQVFEAAAITITPDETVPQVHRFYVTDPFGNRIEFLQDGDVFPQL